MFYIFYNPKKMVIMGISNDPNSMQFPYVEAEKKYHSTQNLGLQKRGENDFVVTYQGKQI